MSTPYMIVRCRMRDLISCFNACKVLTKEDCEDSVHQKPKASSSNDYWKCEREKQLELGSAVEKGGGGSGEEMSTSWQSCDSEEDEYIVFYFKDDGAGVDVIEERCLESSSCRKQYMFNGNCQKKLEICEIQVNSKMIPSKIDKVNESEQHESQEHKDTLGDSSDSSTSSFTFPTIHKEWPGSPVLMPRPEGHEHDKRSVCVQCCKF